VSQILLTDTSAIIAKFVIAKFVIYMYK